ncbi:hypothetical protein ACLOJK_019457 [Asimina triloba]
MALATGTHEIPTTAAFFPTSDQQQQSTSVPPPSKPTIDHGNHDRKRIPFRSNENPSSAPSSTPSLIN